MPKKILIDTQHPQYSNSKSAPIYTSNLTFPICYFFFQGFFVSLGNIPVYLHWITYIAYVRYGFEGVMLAIYGSNREPLHCSEPYCHFKYPVKFLEKLDLDQGVFWIDVVSLLVFFVGLRVIGYFVLRYKVRMER